jgi:shikimate kinase
MEGVHPDIRHVACIGLMAAGESTVGARIADSLGWPFVDVDAEVEASTGKTVAELSYEGGEEAYRPRERNVVVDRLADTEPSVVMAAGGIALDPDARRAIGAADVVAVYLRADPDALASMAKHELEHEYERRPTTNGRLAVLQGMFRDRDATYRAIADIEVRIDAHSPADAAELVVAALTGEAGRGPRALP